MEGKIQANNVILHVGYSAQWPHLECILQKEALGVQRIWSSYSAAAVSVGPSGLTLLVLGDLASSRMNALFQPKIHI